MEKKESRWKSSLESLKSESGVVEIDGLVFNPNIKIANGCNEAEVFPGLFCNGPVAVKRFLKHINKSQLKIANFLCSDRLKTKHLLQPLTVIEDTYLAYLVLPLCEYNLKDLIENKDFPERQNLTEQWRLGICQELLLGLQELHSHGMFHGDLKPENILFDINNKMCIGDFGASRNLDPTDTASFSLIGGTLSWASYEDVGDIKSKSKKESDIQVAGCLVHYILTDGQHPFQTTTPYFRDPTGLIHNIRMANFTLQCDERWSGLKDIITRMLSRSLEECPTIEESLKAVMCLPHWSDYTGTTNNTGLENQKAMEPPIQQTSDETDIADSTVSDLLEISDCKPLFPSSLIEEEFSEFDMPDYSDAEEEVKDVSEEEDGEEYNPEHDKSSSSSEEEEDKENPEAESEAFLSKNGQITWSSETYDQHGRHAKRYIVKMTPGPTRYAVSRVHDIVSTFYLFITPAIKKIILEMTNREGFRKFGDSWKKMDEIDLQAYIGLLILAGVYRSRGEAAASLWDAESGRPIFRATMALSLFRIYSKLIQFDDRETRPARRVKDKLAPIREVWDKWVERLPYLYNPGPDVTVDEQLVPFRGCCPFRQYIPSKPAKYGIKSWVASESSYAWKMQIYTGKSTSGCPEKNQGMRVVLDVTEGLRGHNVTCDNFFTSYELGQQLLKRKITMIGTVRKNKPELPPALLTTKERKVFSSKFAFTPTTTLVSYLPKKNKNVVLMSTLHKDGDISNREDRKPNIILDYNHTKGGVDNLDKVIGTYSCRRMTARWPLVIFHNIIDVSSYNAFVIWREINPSWMSAKTNKRRVFLEQLGKALVTPHIERRTHVPRTEASAAVVKAIQRAAAPDQPKDPSTTVTSPAKPNKRKRCQFCPQKKDCKTYTACCKCKKYICKGLTLPYCPTCAN
ncbi:piggyBac transposable element-derived protein 4-like [Poecilia latipinna]|uniref:piggyBac transposable element-derived protein 4-like n=1 Tax=Poecilia latipinna TaxID=48699 RepID=UPI00072DA296|nr:PREDICTED: piggyBac transposable element-derived protein 4-like [Poecilia latipinna]